MRFITCASYYGTGSSAITDLIGECDNVLNMTDYEFRFIQDPDGIRDLEYNLVENNNRHNSGYAIKRYERNVKFLAGNKLIKKYNLYFGDNWVKLSREYVKALIDVEYKGSWVQDLRDKGKIAYFLNRCVNKVVSKFNKEKSVALFLKNNTNYASYPGEKFYELTKKYIYDLFNSVNKDNKEIIMADQLVPPTNVDSYLRYFDDIKVVCVDRDPRDVFVLEKIWNGAIVPRKVDEFCKWYKATRAHRKTEKNDETKVLRIRFEDLIYHYDEWSSKILDFCEISKDHHTAPKTLLDPAKSIKNTRVWKRFPEYENDIKIIEQELSEYLYDYEGC